MPRCLRSTFSETARSLLLFVYTNYVGRKIGLRNLKSFLNDICTGSCVLVSRTNTYIVNNPVKFYFPRYFNSYCAKKINLCLKRKTMLNMKKKNQCYQVCKRKLEQKFQKWVLINIHIIDNNCFV